MTDKYYTNNKNVQFCLSKLNELYELKDVTFLEPSAGDGSFLKYLNNYIAYDIEPENNNIIKQDFLDESFKLKRNDYITIGNPPFAKRGKMAIAFFNKCALYSEIIAFILPNTFKKFSIQKQLNKDFKLIFESDLINNIFLHNKKNKEINCVYQIWVKTNSKYDIYKDIKVKKPPSNLKDVLIYQHNATLGTRKYIDYDWEYATYRQGFKDYSILFTKEKDYDFIKQSIYNSNNQFFFMKPLTEQARNVIINEIDFVKLSNIGVTTKGFGKSDFIQEYIKVTKGI